SGQNEHCDCQSCSSMFHLWRLPWGTKLRSPGTFWLMPTGAPANQPSVRHAGPGLLAEPSTVLMSVMLKKEEARRGNAYLVSSLISKKPRLDVAALTEASAPSRVCSQT